MLTRRLVITLWWGGAIGLGLLAWQTAIGWGLSGLWAPVTVALERLAQGN